MCSNFFKKITTLIKYGIERFNQLGVVQRKAAYWEIKYKLFWEPCVQLLVKLISFLFLQKETKKYLPLKYFSTLILPTRLHKELILYVGCLERFWNFFLPALSLFPGDTPAQEAKCLDDGNWFISVLISAIIQAAVWSFIPDMDVEEST